MDAEEEATAILQNIGDYLPTDKAWDRDSVVNVPTH
jgi:hypothetical protein